MNRPKLSIVVPIYNEDELLSIVLPQVYAVDWSPKELILVNDCSDDDTPRILAEYEPRQDTTVLHHSQRCGKGAAIRTGLVSASGEIVIVQDADLEYDPNDIPSVVQPIADGEVDICFGSRFKGSIHGMRLPNKIANHILAWTVSLLFRRRITDEATCYKAFRKEVLESLNLECQRFEFCPEVTAKALKAGHAIKEVPVSYRARTFEEGKKIGWRDFIQAMQVLIKIRFS